MSQETTSQGAATGPRRGRSCVRRLTAEPRRHGRLLRQINRGTLRLAFVLMMTCLLVVGCGDNSTEPASDPSASTNGQAEDPPAPPKDWSLPVIDAAGFDELRAQAQREGKVLVVDCWATWCGSCVAMFPKLHDAMAQRSDKARLVSFCYDENEPGGEDYLAKARQFLVDQHAWEDAYLVDPSAKEAIGTAASADWDSGALPAVFVFSPDGELAYALLETRGDVDDWVAQIAEAVNRAAEDSPGR